MLAKNDDAARGGFGETFAEAHVLCLRAIPEARRLEDVEGIRAIVIRLARYARRAMNPDRISVKMRKLCERIGGERTSNAAHANARVASRDRSTNVASRDTPIHAVIPIIARLRKCRWSAVKIRRARRSQPSGA